jgi:hypothetical protein
MGFSLRLSGTLRGTRQILHANQRGVTDWEKILECIT